MSHANPSATEAVGQALTADRATQSRRENQIAARILAALVMVVVVLAVIVVLFGLPALYFIGLFATVVVFVLLIAYATGF